ncbi:MAG: MBL fold metallo-hydrolase [Planctomycetota bacterium]|jgi:glyoxylase-like metal-dependent hydrolase (beta-lactamase superfamily II)
MQGTPRIETFVLGEFQTNCYVVTPPGRAECWIVDCGFEPDPMLDHISRRGLTPVALLLTHTHPDHIAGVDAALGRFGPLPLYVHEAEAGYCSDATLNLSALMGMPVTVTEPDHTLRGGGTLELDGLLWRVVHAPGHSPGGVLYVHDESKQAIVGDTLFAGSIGRMDFPSSDPAALRLTISEVLMGLPDDMTIYPGHGEVTTIGRERTTNPFVVYGF